LSGDPEKEHNIHQIGRCSLRSPVLAAKKKKMGWGSNLQVKKGKKQASAFRKRGSDQSEPLKKSINKRTKPRPIGEPRLRSFLRAGGGTATRLGGLFCSREKIHASLMKRKGKPSRAVESNGSQPGGARAVRGLGKAQTKKEATMQTVNRKGSGDHLIRPEKAIPWALHRRGTKKNKKESCSHSKGVKQAETTRTHGETRTYSQH